MTDVYLMDSLFIRPGHCHYYYGDYYGPAYYVALGFENAVSRAGGIMTRSSFRRWHNPRWYD